MHFVSGSIYVAGWWGTARLDLGEETQLVQMVAGKHRDVDTPGIRALCPVCAACLLATQPRDRHR